MVTILLGYAQETTSIAIPQETRNADLHACKTPLPELPVDSHDHEHTHGTTLSHTHSIGVVRYPLDVTMLNDQRSYGERGQTSPADAKSVSVITVQPSQPEDRLLDHSLRYLYLRGES